MRHPYLAEKAGKKILVVNDQPFIMMAGEVHNSSSSSLEFMETVWEKAMSLGMNSLLLPVTWELMEPEEGVYDFSLMDGLINQARRYGSKLGFLWFGTWKNAQCYYAPAWVKTDLERFKRAEVEKGEHFARLKSFFQLPYSTMSYLCENTKRADAKAFAELLKHIREVDEEQQTVIIVQVENETGLMGSARERSEEADAKYASQVPSDFVRYMKEHTDAMVADVRAAVEQGKADGTWEEAFGVVAEEIFSAYHIASYVNEVAAAGKQQYPIPMSANCWLDKKEDKPGQYPTGGPVSRVMEVWQYCAPNIDIITPDIYVPYFYDVCDEYTRRGNPLFIPETPTHSYAASRQVYTVGHYHGICFSPFAFEDMGKPFGIQEAHLFGVDTGDPVLATPQNVEEYAYLTRALQAMMPRLTEKYGTSDLQAVTSERPEEDTMVFGEFGFKVTWNSPEKARKAGVCLILKESEGTFYLLLDGCGVSAFSTSQEKPYVDFLAMEEGKFADGKWTRGRRLNGDELMKRMYDEPVLLKMHLFAYR